jgi:hypothetical protein
MAVNHSNASAHMNATNNTNIIHNMDTVDAVVAANNAAIVASTTISTPKDVRLFIDLIL